MLRLDWLLKRTFSIQGIRLAVTVITSAVKLSLTVAVRELAAPPARGRAVR